MSLCPRSLPTRSAGTGTRGTSRPAWAARGAAKGEFSMCYCAEEAALALTLRKMSSRNMQGAFFIARGPGGEAVVMSRGWNLAC